MSDKHSAPVQQAINDLKDLVDQSKAVEADVLQVYSQRSLMKVKKAVGLPGVAVVFLSLRGKADSSRTGGSADLELGVFLLGGDTCEEIIDNVVQDSIAMLGDIRNCVMASCVDTPRARRKWQFVLEVPVDIGNISGYVQRWRTTINLIPPTPEPEE